jgi:AMP-polyphosphate phosphotransferase
MSVLARLDLTRNLSERDYDRRLPGLQSRLHELQAACHRREIGTVVVFEGWDAAGKGGAIRRVTPTLDPRGFEVVPVGAPEGDEKKHHYLWRFWKHIPLAGHIAIFDRSWYGRVLVERVEGFSSSEEWRRAYGEIVEFERQLVDSGLVVVKFWLHISRAEQLRRFRDRAGERIKRYKIGPEDWRNRRKWGRYETAVEDMVRRTNRPAPWTLVEAEDKRWARVRILESLGRAMEEALVRASPAKKFRRVEKRLKKFAKWSGV